MKSRLLHFAVMTFKVVIIMCSTLFLFGAKTSVPSKSYSYSVIDINKSKTVELIHNYVDYKIITKLNRDLPLFTSKVAVQGEQGIVATTSYSDKKISIKEPIDEVIEVGQGNPQSFAGDLTGYGPDCVGCSGIVACYPNVNVENTIYYNDKEFNQVRIVAADKNIPCGTIVEISNYKFANEPIVAIVLDRGGLIYGKKMDLLHSSEKETEKIGYQRNINYKILRWGWNK